MCCINVSIQFLSPSLCLSPVLSLSPRVITFCMYVYVHIIIINYTYVIRTSRTRIHSNFPRVSVARLG